MMKQVHATREDLSILKTRSEQYMTREDVRQLTDTMRESMQRMQSCYEDTQHDVQALSQSSAELQQRVASVFSLHEQGLKKQAEQEELEREKKIELLQAEIDRREEKHKEEMRLQGEKFDERRFINRMRKNWVPFIAGVCGAILALTSVVVGVIKIVQWISSHVHLGGK